MKSRWIGGLVVVAALAAAVGIYALLSSLNALLAQAIERHGTEATGTRVAVSGVDVSLKEGRGSIAGLEIASPKGYSSAHAFLLEQIEIDIDLSSLRDDPIVIESVLISSPSVNAEFARDGSSNLDEIKKHLDRYSAESGAGRGDGAASGEARKIRIRSFRIEEGEISVDASALGVERRSIRLPEMRLEDVGGSDGGSPEELTAEILGAVVKRATHAVAGSEVQRFIKDKLSEPIKEGAERLLDALKN